MNTTETAFRAVLDLSWRSSVLIVAVLVIRALLQGRVPAWVFHAAWIAVAIRLLMPVSFEAGWSPLGAATHATAVHTNPATDMPGAHAEVPGTVEPMTAAEPAPEPAGTGVTLVQWIATAWLAGVAGLLLMRVAAHARFIRAVRRSSSPAGPSLVHAMACVAADRGEHPIGVWESGAVSTPALHGLFRPRLLFPQGMADQFTPSALRMIAAHELAHLRRRDLLAQSLMRAAVVVHWFNPLVWIAARAARGDCELACDETVLRRLEPSQREAYGSTLIEVVNLARFSPPPPLALGVVESKHDLRRRIKMIAHQHQSAPIRAAIGATAFLAIAVVSLSKETQTKSATATRSEQMEQSAKRSAEARAAAESRESQSEKTVAEFKETLAKTNFHYGPDSDGLDSRFPDGVVATVGDRRITVADVRREADPLISRLKGESTSQDDFDRRLRLMQNDIIGHLVNRFLVVKEFHEHSETVPEKHVAAEYVDKALAEVINARFGGDRNRLLEWLKDRGITLEQYRREVEEDIIYSYMKAQERRLLKGADTNPAVRP